MRHQEASSDRLDRLLGVKRCEKPPPGYFLSFSDKVVARIEAEQTVAYSTWWSWLVERFDAKPALVCAYSLAVSMLLLGGFRLSQAFEAELAATPTLSGPWLAATPASPVLLSDEFGQAEYASLRNVSVAKLGQEPRQLPLPTSGLRLLTASFPLSTGR